MCARRAAHAAAECGADVSWPSGEGDWGLALTVSFHLIVLLVCADGVASIVFTSCHVFRLDLAPLVLEQQRLLKVGVVSPERYL